MAPLNSSNHLATTLIRHLNNTIAGHTAIDARGAFVPNLTPPQARRVVGIIIGGIITGIIFTILVCRCVEAGTRGPPPDAGHVYGRDSVNNASSIVLAALRSGSSYERPRFQEVESRALGNRVLGGAAVARPAPAVSRDSAVWDESPPPPYPQPPKYKS